MKLGRPLPRRFFARPCLEVARELVGKIVVRRWVRGERIVARIVEVEAYLGDGSDPAAHSHPGPTPRNRSMFGPPGHLYAYRSYGVHTCANVVCEPVGCGAAVLLRAAEPLEGVGHMQRLRGMSGTGVGPMLSSGPGRLAQALGLRLEDDGMSVVSGALTFHAPHQAAAVCVEVGPRVGITRAAKLPYRFYAKDSPWVSVFRAGGRRRRA